eukprot:COSAG06_NODE_52547_length_305_cov_0.601942_1_plen_81_part_01
MTVGESQLIKADGSADPFPCDGTLPDCAGEHDGSVVVEGPSAINMAAPLAFALATRTASAKRNFGAYQIAHGLWGLWCTCK